MALADRAGASFAPVLGVSVSRSTVLRLVDALPEPEVAALRVVGVGEYATRKGRHYGTVLVDIDIDIDIETRRPVDLLPDREASSLSPGSPTGQALRSFAGTGHRSSPKAPPSAPRRPSRLWTDGTSGTT
jgi:hypothetical protein